MAHNNIEIEIHVNIENQKPLMDFLKSLECGKNIRNYAGYPYLLLFPNEVEYEEL